MDNNKLDILVNNFHALDKKLEVVSKLLEQHLEDDTNNLNRIVNSLENIDNTLADNTRELTVHIEGVRQAQENNKLLREELQVYKLEVQAKVSELEKPKIVVNGIMWILGFIGAVLGVLVAIKQFF